ncbi:hypothetical protein QFZ84_001028 [Pseudomonas fluorescens]|jgi:hypothetical protein|uniref:Uncharacterized protein n=1 Tax=Pseudomonas fluorescens HK44 TaxID=1042209 RepID=A0A010S7N9_PSEFL|nr:hypothetical protein HK44_015970 [Pseudomonas fluorescens HK44]
MDFFYLLLGALFLIILVGLTYGCAALNRRRS